MIQRLFFISLLAIASSCKDETPSTGEQTIHQRLSYLYNLKSFINAEVWPGFTDKRFDLPLVYYTDSVCYVANPTEYFVQSKKPTLVFTTRDLEVYKTPLLDSIPFHMETSVTFGDSSDAYNYKSPFMNCSSFEITQKTIPDVNSTEQWSTMVLHEYFHGFQFKHPAFLEYFQKNFTFAEDSLKRMYKRNDWFKSSVDTENRLLLAALETNEPARIGELIDSLFIVRGSRRDRATRELGVDVRTMEQIFETMEGTARYAEYSLYSTFATKTPDDALAKVDSSYHSYEYFRDYNIEKDQWLYLSEKTTGYFYATGFNMVRLLEKLKVDYKERLFYEGALSLEGLLRNYRERE